MINRIISIMVAFCFVLPCKGQSKMVFIDSKYKIKYEVTNFKSYMFLNIENFGDKPIFVPDFFRIENDCGRMDCYLSNNLDFYPFVEETLSIVEIKPKNDWGVIVEILEDNDFTIKTVYMAFTFTNIKEKEKKVLNLIDLLDKSYPLLRHD